MRFSEDVIEAALAKIATSFPPISAEDLDAESLSIRKVYQPEWSCEGGCCHEEAGMRVYLDSYLVHDVVRGSGDMFGPEVYREGLSMGVMLSEGSDDFGTFSKVAETQESDKS